MLPYLIVIFIAVPVVELWIIVKVGQAISWGPTLAILIAVGLLGSALARHEGMRTWRRIREDLAHARMPSDHLLEGMMILLAGVMMITPGFLTDIFGVLLLLPPVRAGVRQLIKTRISRRINIIQHFHWSPGSQYPPSPGKGDVIDTDARPEP